MVFAESASYGLGRSSGDASPRGSRELCERRVYRQRTRIFDSAWGWNPDVSTSDSENDENQLDDSEADLRLAEDDSVAERLQNFTSRDQRSHQQFATEAWNRNPGFDSPSETPTDAPETTEAATSEWWKSATDESVTGSTQSGWHLFQNHSRPKMIRSLRIAMMLMTPRLC